MLIPLSDIQSKSKCHKNERLDIGVLGETLLSTEWCARGQGNVDLSFLFCFSGLNWGLTGQSSGL